MLSEEHRNILRDIAYRSIESGLNSRHPLRIEHAQYDAALLEQRATFVTLNIDHQLRGCIGMLEPIRPLIEDVAENAFSAAFNDSRFQPLARDELNSISIHISILGTPEEIDFSSEQDLIDQLVAGKDGLILIADGRRATFLPSVWESILDKREFVEHLKQKAGLPRHYWSDSIRALRYRVEDF